MFGSVPLTVSANPRIRTQHWLRRVNLARAALRRYGARSHYGHRLERPHGETSTPAPDCSRALFPGALRHQTILQPDARTQQAGDFLDDRSHYILPELLLQLEFTHLSITSQPLFVSSKKAKC